LRPIETTVSIPHAPRQEISITYRGIYRDYVKKQFPMLPRSSAPAGIPAPAPAAAEVLPAAFPGRRRRRYSATGGRNAGDDLEADTWIVDWSKENQAYFQNVRLNWSHMPDEAPSTLQMLYAQEDLWCCKLC